MLQDHPGAGGPLGPRSRDAVQLDPAQPHLLEIGDVVIEPHPGLQRVGQVADHIAQPGAHPAGGHVPRPGEHEAPELQEKSGQRRAGDPIEIIVGDNPLVHGNSFSDKTFKRIIHEGHEGTRK